MTLSILIGAAIALQRPPPEVEARFVECGIARSAVSLRMDEYFGEPEALIAGTSASFADAALLCAIEAASRAGYSARFADETADARARSLWRARSEVEMRQRSRARLAELDILDRLADYDPERQTLAAYARSLEAMCGIAPGAALAAAEPDILTIQGIMAGATGPDERFTCLFNSLLASNLAERGVVIGMVGRGAEPASADAPPLHSSGRKSGTER